MRLLLDSPPETAKLESAVIYMRRTKEGRKNKKSELVDSLVRLTRCDEHTIFLTVRLLGEFLGQQLSLIHI